MTRFYSEYEIKKQDKNLSEALFDNTDKYKEELNIAINEENHRSNVDRAKKKSCAQYFDYDKFHQMVLGADLKGMKLDEVIKIEPEKAILNPISEIKNKQQHNGNFSNQKFFSSNILQNDSINLNKFKIEFKKFESPLNKINYLYDNFTKERFYELLNVDNLDADLFSSLILTIGTYLKEVDKSEKNDKVNFLFDCLDIIEKTKYFSKNKMFIGKKHKEPYKEILNNQEFIHDIPNADQIIDKIIK